MELKVSELTAQVQKLTEELARLRANSNPLTLGSENQQGSEWCIRDVVRLGISDATAPMLKDVEGQQEDRGRQRRTIK